ncbi:IS1182 family transposase [Planomicrobium okeanokoites]|uniref:IS1182 family transposase n=1 Tax=Planomicrobium okeanokoites TaxID=244 RepID=A0ABV7KLA2_PLAOK|nr:IS1182 family transposase [Planomicrobium okeanokoites]TAA69374.1 IS1182 family transposase [Planomicrobium okeanokoites]
MMPDRPSMKPSPYVALYDIVIPQDHIFRRINELVDFSFVTQELAEKYCSDNGRMAIHPIRMFKYLLLKSMNPLSDVDLVERSKFDLSYKFFLDMAPEESVIDPSSLTKFRKLRLEDSRLLDLLIEKTIAIAIALDLIETGTIIVDATHTQSRYHLKKPQEILQDQSRKLRKNIYSVNESMKEQFPKKNTKDDLEAELNYCKELIASIERVPSLSANPKIGESLRLLEETMADDIEQLRCSKDPDARTGHKSADTAFFGYKTHLAMSVERLVTAAIVTTGEKNDGKLLQSLIEKSCAAGVNVNTVIGDTAYSEKSNLQYAEKNHICLISKLNPLITDGYRKKEDEFDFNKDAGMYVCKAGHMAIRKARQGKKGVGKNQKNTYFFDIERCKRCPLREGCYKEGAKSKTYSVSIKSTEHAIQRDFQESEFFKKAVKERYKIEAKNGELKNRHGYRVTSGAGLSGMALQGAMAIFTVNLKRILRLLDERRQAADQ